MSSESITFSTAAGRRRLLLTLKKYSYLIAMIPLVLPPLLLAVGESTGLVNAFSWGVPVVVFGIIPLLDLMLGKDALNPDEQSDVPRLNQEKYYRAVTLIWVVAYAALLGWGVWVLASGVFSLVGALGWVVSIGIVGGLGINVAHELIHKDDKLETWAGGFLLSMVCYAGFKVEHIRGHHVHVSTPEDASSSRYNQSLYSFLPHAYVHNFLNAWKLEAERLKRKGHAPVSWRNELIWWYGISALLLVVFSVAFGWLGALFFLGQSFIAFTLLEIVNYLEHYGLHRRKLENGRYERTTPEHSWNSNYFLTNVFLFQLQRHSDHHAYAKRRYQVLRHHEIAPQLPAGYATMVVLACFPPLWRKVMNPRVEAYYRGEEHQLQS
ncbi:MULTISPECIES: alkane 1-monooxygenase [Marinobacter]|jgi:alkane 1-monooxygenase|uniref:Alkane-1 monooxygenase n=1 Tax=Marinobacter nauticus TaxID=2743 RepID=A0A833JQ93_MARNT|nr:MULTISPECIES: alkane 1-monooxygenase [Marinobacter]MCG8523107.1 alkane 1-monooxygenase [Pseudomonadales bacterium]ERS84236.1 alkane 1-monooxygenase [Marinobacter sp. C1S70]KAE8545743.1 Alkane-1 monooxygenase [Marinobacter nauticus]MBY5936409.1 alkane 1-monooxygenase [Marinobacter nauticus]MBY5953638.1 alkane 1-monooxygenase [Marinobacter nauticus]